MADALVTRRSLVGGFMGLSAAALLAACGGQAASPTAAPAKPAETKPADAKPAATTAAAGQPTAAAPAGGGRTKVVVWAGDLATADESTPTGKWAKWIRTTFQEKNPKFEVDAQDKGWDQALRTGLLTAIAGNAVPDVTTGEAFVHEFASLGAFNAVPDLNIKDFAYGPVAGSIYKGKLYGVPVRTSPFALETNKRTAEKAGIDPAKPPKTWDELVANAEKAFKAGKDAGYVGFNLYGPAPNRIYGTVLRTIPWINQTGKPLADDDGTQAFMNSKEHVAAYELSRKLFKTADPGNSFSGDEGKLYAYVWQDKAVYQVSAIWNVFNARDQKAESVFHPLPRQEASRSGNVVLGNAVYSVLAKAKNIEGGVALQKFMAEPDTQKQLGIIMGRLPTVASVLQDPKLEELAAFAPVKESVRTFADILLKEDVRPVPPFSKNPDKVWIAWGDMFGKILQGTDPIQPMLDQLQSDVEKLIK